MQKVQILFPDPLMEEMRAVAAKLDIPLSEVVRRATESWLERFPKAPHLEKLKVPVFRGGRCLVDADEMKELIYE